MLRGMLQGLYGRRFLDTAVKGKNRFAVKGKNNTAVKGKNSTAFKGKNKLVIKGKNRTAAGPLGVFAGLEVQRQNETIQGIENPGKGLTF